MVVPGGPNCFSVGKAVRSQAHGFDWWAETGARLHVPLPKGGYRVIRLDEVDIWNTHSV